MMRPNSLLTESLEMLKKGRVLDLGSGDGANIAFLRENGFEVRGVEKNYGETIEDFIKIPGEKWDNIISFFTIHFLTPKKAREVYFWIKKNTSPGGLNIMIDFTSEGEWDTSETKGFYFEKNDMRKMYEDWELLFYEENLTSTYDGSKQVAAFLVAKKPYSQK